MIAGAARAWIGRACLAGLALWGCLFASRFWDHKLLLGDEGVAVLGAWRILEGQVPGRDFFEIIPPFSFLPTALALKVFGLNLGAERGVVLLLAGLVVVLTDRVLARIGAPTGARAFSLAVLIPFGVLYWPVPSHHWWVDLLQLGSALALMRVPSSARPHGPAFASGAFAGLALFTLQDQGLLFFLALGALFWWPSRKKPWCPGALAAWGVGLGSAAVPFIAWLLPTAGWKALWEGWVQFPLSAYRNIPGHKFNALAGWEEVGTLWSSGVWSGAPLYVALLTGCALVLLLLPLAAGIALVAAWRREGSERPRVGILGALAAAFLGTALHRWALTNAVWAAPGLLAILGVAFSPMRGGSGKGLRKTCGWALWGLALLFLSYGIAFYRLGATPIVIETRAGTLRSLARGEARALDQLLAALERGPAPGEPVFCLGFHSFVNFLSGRPNPTRFNLFYPSVYNTRAHSEEVARQLASGEIRWVCVGAASIPPADDPTGRILRERYAPRFQNARFILLERTDPPGGKKG